MLHQISQSPARFEPEQSLMESMKSIFASLSEDELDAFEDDLNFCRFTGLPSERIEAMIRIVAKASPELAVALNEVDHAA
jgi:hypothetical protein